MNSGEIYTQLKPHSRTTGDPGQGGFLRAAWFDHAVGQIQGGFCKAAPPGLPFLNAANPGLVAPETNREATTTKTYTVGFPPRISAELRAPSSTGRRLVHQGRASADLAARAVDLAGVARCAWFDFP